MNSKRKCPDCGAEIVVHSVRVLGCEMQQVQKCPCVVERESKEAARRVASGKPLVIQRWQRECGLKIRQQHQTFASFITKPGQEDALQAAQRFVLRYPDTEGLMLVGGVGGGKTHLAAAVVNGILEKREITNKMAEDEYRGSQFPSGRVSAIQFTSAVDMLADIKNSFDTQEDTQSVINKYARAKLLVLDDLCAEKPSEWVIERIFEIVDHRYNDLLATVITSNATPAELKERLGDRIYDRLREMCKMITVKAQSQRVTA